MVSISYARLFGKSSADSLSLIIPFVKSQTPLVLRGLKKVQVFGIKVKYGNRSTSFSRGTSIPVVITACASALRHTWPQLSLVSHIALTSLISGHGVTKTVLCSGLLVR